MKTGVINPSKISGVWQKIYDYTVEENEGINGNDKLICSFDGADEATAFTAEIGGAFTFAGTAQLDTAQKKLGTASLLLDGNSMHFFSSTTTT